MSLASYCFSTPRYLHLQNGDKKKHTTDMQKNKGVRKNPALANRVLSDRGFFTPFHDLRLNLLGLFGGISSRPKAVEQQDDSERYAEHAEEAAAEPKTEWQSISQEIDRERTAVIRDAVWRMICVLDAAGGNGLNSDRHVAHELRTGAPKSRIGPKVHRAARVLQTVLPIEGNEKQGERQE